MPNFNTNYPERYKMLGLKISYYRRKCGFTQEQLAEMIGLSQNFLSQVESRQLKGVSLETLFKLADVLGIEPTKLLEMDD